MADDKILQYKCPCCGGTIEFDSKLQKLRCPYCDTEFDADTLRGFDDGLKSTADNTPEWDPYGEDSGNGNWREGETDGMVSYVCKSCGGEVIGDKNTAATVCPFCGNNVIVTQQFSGTLRPDYVIPFKIDKEGAKTALKNFMKGKKLLPDSFTDENRIDSIQGIYVPFWLFDADADASLSFRATQVSCWSDSNYDYTRTSYYQVLRAGKIAFDRVPVDGSKKMDDTYMEAIEPYNHADLEDFGTPYLAGYLADRYDVDADASTPRANERIKNSTAAAFRATVHGYASCTPTGSNINLSNRNIRYALLPVWLLNTKYRDEMYTFAMNGQTGKFIGKLPVDRSKYWKYWGIVFGIAAAIGIALAFLL